MEKTNKDRIVVRIIKELSQELNIQVQFFCFNWLIRLSSNTTVKHIMGYDWELNSSTSQLIAKDKSACYEILSSQGIDAIEHRLFLSPQFQNYISGNGSWQNIVEYAKKFNYKIVCKSNVGTGGNEVFKVTNQLDLETFVHTLFSQHRGICLCPFYDIQNEYRVIVLNGEALLIYAKKKPIIKGDGKKTIFELIKDNFEITSWGDFEIQKLDINSILPDQKELELSWKHNLGKGAKAVIVEDLNLKQKLTELALNAANAINISFASVDIAECGDKLLVMEINSGIMTENFAQQGNLEYDIAKKIYKNALIQMFDNKIS